MNADDILDIIGNTADKYVRDAHETKSERRKRHIFNLAVGAAACLVLAPTVLFGGMWLFFGGMGASAPAPEASEPSSYGHSHYEGPLLPLTALNSGEGIAAERNVDISLAPISDGIVDFTDSYVLTNTGSEAVSLELAYPYLSSYYDASNPDSKYGSAPLLSVNGSAAHRELVYGPYTGSFVPVYGAEDDPEMATANLSGLTDFYDYVNLLEDGSYLERSFAAVPKLEQSVTVYKLSDYEYSSDTEAENPTLKFSFEADSSKSSVLTWNFNGGSNFGDEGYYERMTGGIEIRPNASPGNIYPEDAYVIVLGEDIKNVAVEGYRNGGCEKGDELDDLGCSISKYECTLGEILREMLETEYYYGNRIYGDIDALYSMAAAALMDFGPIGANPVTRYNFGMLDSFIYDVCTQSRVCYLSFSVTISAGESVEIELSGSKALSFNYYGTGNTDLYGFELGTALGSNLEFTELNISVRDYEGTEIVDGNIGLSPENGLSETVLDLNSDRQWMTILKIPIEE